MSKKLIAGGGESVVMMAEWAEVMCMHWPRLRYEWLDRGALYRLALAELTVAFRGHPPSGDELLRAVRWLAGPEARQDRVPALRQLIIAVFTQRREDRPDDSGGLPPCALCRSKGWAMVVPGAEPSALTGEAYFLAVWQAVPCVCAHGERVRRTCEPHKSGRMSQSDQDASQRLADLAGRQYEAAARMWREDATKEGTR